MLSEEKSACVPIKWHKCLLADKLKAVTVWCWVVFLSLCVLHQLCLQGLSVRHLSFPVILGSTKEPTWFPPRQVLDFMRRCYYFFLFLFFLFFFFLHVCGLGGRGGDCMETTKHSHPHISIVHLHTLPTHSFTLMMTVITKKKKVTEKEAHNKIESMLEMSTDTIWTWIRNESWKMFQCPSRSDFFFSLLEYYRYYFSLYNLLYSKSNITSQAGISSPWNLPEMLVYSRADPLATSQEALW